MPKPGRQFDRTGRTRELTQETIDELSSLSPEELVKQGYVANSGKSDPQVSKDLKKMTDGNDKTPF